MQEDESTTDQEAMSFSSGATLMGANMPICTTPTNINAIILNSQIPGAQRIVGTVAESATSPSTTAALMQQAVTHENQSGHVGVDMTRQGYTNVHMIHQVQDSVDMTSKGQRIVTVDNKTHQAQARLAVGVQRHVGVTVTRQAGTSMTQQSQAGLVVTSRDHANVNVAPQDLRTMSMTAREQGTANLAPQEQVAVSMTHQGYGSVSKTSQGQGHVSITKAQLPIISAAAGTSLRLPSIVAVEGAIKPDISLCSRVLKSFSDQDQASSDLEVQSVMFPETRGLLPTVKRICPSRSSSSSKSSKSSYSPMRQPTTLTNAKRGNVQTATPTFLPEDMTIHQLAAQGELTILSERIENFEIDTIDKTDVQGYTPLMWACAHDQIDVVEFLVRFGADASKASTEGECALSFASSNGNVDLVRLLLAENVDVNNYDWNGGTPLLYSVYNDHPKCCELLLQAGADMTIETDGGHTALSLALALGHQRVQQVIEKHMLGLLQL